jgi:adenosine/AMP kinase
MRSPRPRAGEKEEKMAYEVQAVELAWDEGANIIVGQSHFIKTAEDIAEILNCSVPGVEYGLAFCEASGPCLIRTEGNDEKLIAQATECARRVGAGHSFFLVLRKAYPINVLNQIKSCPEVARVYCATSNPLQVLVVETGQGRGIVGVVDGFAPKGVEGPADKRERRELLRKFGYKFG